MKDVFAVITKSFIPASSLIILSSSTLAAEGGKNERHLVENQDEKKLEAERLYAHAEDIYNKEGKETKLSMKFLKRAAELGHALAMLDLGYVYKEGEIVKRDLKKAAELFTKSARLGNAEAQECMGNAYKNGLGVLMDEKRAFHWYSRAAKQGNKYAQEELAHYYELGNQVEKDLKKAAELFEKSARQGWMYAQDHLGRMYLQGKGVKKDLVKSYAWYSLTTQATQDAINEGDDGVYEAEERVETLESYMTEEQLKKAKELSKKLLREIHGVR